jgi:hypothetical protein
METSIRRPFTTAVPPRLNSSIQPLHLLLLIGVSAAAIVWGLAMISGGEGLDLEQYLVILGIYGIASTIFVLSRIRENHVHFFDIPVFVTAVGFVRFGLVPMRAFLDPSAETLLRFDRSPYFIRGLLYWFLGMLAFWLACHLFQKPKATSKDESLQSREVLRVTGSAPLAWPILIYAFAFITRTYMLESHLYSYATIAEIYYSQLSLAQVLIVIDWLGSIALLIVTIERFSHPYDGKRRVLFILIFTLECSWGFISGMKGLVFQNFMLVALVSSIILRKFPKRLIIATVTGFVLIYPLSNAYRGIISGKGAVEVTDLSTAMGASNAAFAQARLATPGVTGWVQSGVNHALARLDLLQCVATIISLTPAQAQKLEGEEHWWMVPIYPFIPRFLWKDKPILDKGARFSVVLGATKATSTAITPPADLYLQFGLPGLMLGAFLWGILGQGLTDRYGNSLNKRHIFMYAALFPSATNLENDAFSFSASFIKISAMVVILAWLVYEFRVIHEKAEGQTP